MAGKRGALFLKGVSCGGRVKFSTGVSQMTIAAAILEQIKESRPGGCPRAADSRPVGERLQENNRFKYQ